MRGDFLRRQWLTLHLLPAHPRRVSTEAIAEALREQGHDVTRRTVQRDLVKLAEVFAVGFDAHVPTGWYRRGEELALRDGGRP